MKFDDLGGPPRLETFENVVEWGEENQIKMTLGLIGEYLDSSSDDAIRRLKAMADNPLVEIWYHAYDLSATLGTWTNEQQEADFEADMKAAEKHGFEFKTFGAPSGSWNSYTVELLNRYNFKAVFSYVSDVERLGLLDNKNTFTPLHKYITVEKNAVLADGTKKTVVRNFNDLKADWEAAKANGYEYVFLQSHPYHGWNIVTDKDGVTYNNAGNHIYDFLLWLKNSEGVVFMTPMEYVEYAKSL